MRKIIIAGAAVFVAITVLVLSVTSLVYMAIQLDRDHDAIIQLQQHVGGIEQFLTEQIIKPAQQRAMQQAPAPVPQAGGK